MVSSSGQKLAWEYVASRLEVIRNESEKVKGNINSNDVIMGLLGLRWDEGRQKLGRREGEEAERFWIDLHYSLHPKITERTLEKKWRK